jgi:hypothetical protein
MNPNLRHHTGTEPPVCHAHLLAVEMTGTNGLETPAAVMEEVEFRATHVSSLMEEMFREASRRHEWWEETES